MDNNSKYFYISGLISLSLFSLFFLSFVLMLFKTPPVNSFALTKDNYISISLETPILKNKKAKKVVKSAPKPKAEVTPAVNQNIDINNLFSDVWTKKIVQKKEKQKPIDNKRLLEIQKKIQKTKSKDVESLSEKVNNLEKVDTNSENAVSSTAEQVNEYLAKIQAIVYQYFHVPANSEGSSVKSVIELNSLGKVIDFRILSYSDNEALNKEVDKIKDRLRSVIFPKNPQKKSSRTIVILISKE
jgi:protein TonB